MPTIHAKILFNLSFFVESTWEEEGCSKFVFLFSKNDETTPHIERLVSVQPDKRWFHIEVWHERGDGIETYARKALFGSFENPKDGGKMRFIVQNLPKEAIDKEEESIDKEARNRLGDDIRKMVMDLKPKYLLQFFDANISWHELDQSNPCPCFTKVSSDESPDATRTRLHALSKALPIGKIYFMYCFSLANYMEIEKNRVTEIEDKIYKFYINKACQLEKSEFEIKTSNEEETNPQTEDSVKAIPLRFVNAEQRETILNRDAIDFSVFRTKLRNKDWLVNKTYKLTIPDTPVEYFLRLSHTGLIEVRREISLSGNEKNKYLAKILEGLLRYRRVDAEDEHHYINMSRELNQIVDEFARQLINKYVDSLRPKFKLKFRSSEEAQSSDLTTTQPDETSSKTELGGKEPRKTKDRRYVAIVLRDLVCQKNNCKRSIRPSDVHRNIEVVSSLLEGTMIYYERSGELQIPPRPSRTLVELPDLSSWNDEICFFEADRALIYFEPKTILESYNHVTNYEAYWRTIVRGIEHQLSVRTCLQKMETKTTELTEEIPKLLKGSSPPDHIGTLEKLTTEVSEVVALLPKLRQISTTATAFRSSKAINKFERLGRVCFQFPEMLENIQQNVNELVDFFQYSKAQELRLALIQLDEKIKNQSTEQHDQAKELKIRFNTESKEETDRNNKLVTIGLIIAVSTIFFASFSFLTDASTFFNTFQSAWLNPLGGTSGIFNSTGTKSLCVYMILSGILGTIIWLIHKYLDNQLKTDVRKGEMINHGNPSTESIGTGGKALQNPPETANDQEQPVTHNPPGNKKGMIIGVVVLLLLIAFLAVAIIWG